MWDAQQAAVMFTSLTLQQLISPKNTRAEEVICDQLV